jgi:hypothetical protein
MPFAGPETALAATIVAGDMERVILFEIARPAASYASLRIFNDLHRNSTTCTETHDLQAVHVP